MIRINLSDRAARAPTLEAVAAKVAEAAARLPQIEDGTPEQARAFRAERGNPFAPAACKLAAVSDFEIPVRRGKVPARCYEPKGYQLENCGCLIFYHGGGYVLSSVDDYDTVTQRIADFSRCKVISIDYELAPENKIKSIHRDGFEVYRWIRENSAELGINKDRMAVGGDSAGGNLTVAVTLACKRESYAMPVLQILLYPSLDPGMSYPSVEEFASGYYLTKGGMNWFRNHYLENPAQARDPELQFLEQDLSGLPQAYVITAGFDPLRDEGQAYVDRLVSHGVAVQHDCYTDMIHAFVSFAGGIEAGEHAIRKIGSVLENNLCTG